MSVSHEHNGIQDNVICSSDLTGEDGRAVQEDPATVTSVLGAEPEPRLLALARRAAQRAAVPVTVVDGTADSIPAPHDSFDAAVSCLVRCTVANQAHALAELQTRPPSGR